MLEPYEFLDELEGEHRSWLSAFDGRYLRKFEKLLKDHYEAAMTEAAVRRLLERHGVAVEPNEDPMGKVGWTSSRDAWQWARGETHGP